MRAAAIQFFATPFALEQNLKTAERLTREAASQGARLIVLPELFNTGYVYTPKLFSAAENEDGPTVRWLTHLSAELNAILGGTLLLRDGQRLFNTFVLVEPDGKFHCYRKQHPFVWEHCYFESGDTPLIAETSIGRIGLLICWDAAFRSAWEAYRGKVDLVLIASAPPRFHRAVLNFPRARRVYVADLSPELLRHRDAIDDWYLGGLARGARFVGAPVVSAMMAGRFVTTLPFARLSFWLAGMGRPRHWGLGWQANQASLRATFYGCSAAFGLGGEVLSRAAEEEGWVMAEVGGAVTGGGPTRAGRPDSTVVDAADAFFPHVPPQLRLMTTVFQWLGRSYHRQHAR